MKIRNWFVILLAMVVAVTCLNFAHAVVPASAHAIWRGVHMDAQSGIQVTITPTGSNSSASWTYYSDCGRNQVASGFCFETGILPHNTAWIRVEYAQFSDAKFFPVAGSNCGLTGIGRDVFGDANSTELYCQLNMPDFSYGTPYEFKIRPASDPTLGPGNWWLARYANKTTGIVHDLGIFRFDFTVSILSFLSNFSIINQLNDGNPGTDCNALPETSGNFSRPDAIVIQSDNNGISSPLANVTPGELSSSCSTTSSQFKSLGTSVDLAFGGNSIVNTSSAQSIQTTPQDLINNCDNHTSFTSKLTGSQPAVLNEARSSSFTVFDLLVDHIPLGTCMGVDIWLPNTAVPQMISMGLVNQINPSSNLATTGWTTNFRLPINTSSLGCTPFLAKPWYVNKSERSYYGAVWQSNGCAGTPQFTQTLGSYQTFEPISNFPNGVLESQERATSTSGSNNSQTSSSTSSSTGITSTDALVGNLIRPSQGGALTQTKCPTNKFLVGIKISNTIGIDVYNFVQHLQYFCSTMSPEPATYMTSSDLVGFVSQGPGNQSVNTFFCPEGSAAAGLILSTGAYIKDIGLSCYNPISQTQAVSSLRGAGVGLPIDSASKCPLVNGQVTFITGINGYSAAGIDGIQAICGKLDSSVTSQSPVTTDPSSQKSTSSRTPTRPTKPTFSYVTGAIRLFVQVPSLIKEGVKKVFLVAPALGYTSELPLQGTIDGTTAGFNIPTTQAIQGQSIPAQIYAGTDTSQSAPLETTISVPKVVSTTSKSSTSTKTASTTKKSTKQSTPSQQDPDQLNAPDAPTNPGYDISGSNVIVTVQLTQRAGAIAKKVFLVSPQIGISANNPLAGKISGSKARFTIKANPEMAGKTATITIYASNLAGKSPSLSGEVTAPATLPDTGNVAPVPQKTVAQSKVASCKKGAMKRVFTGSACPPGWVKV